MTITTKDIDNAVKHIASSPEEQSTHSARIKAMLHSKLMRNALEQLESVVSNRIVNPTTVLACYGATFELWMQVGYVLGEQAALECMLNANAADNATALSDADADNGVS